MEIGIHSRARPTIASLLVSSGNGYENSHNVLKYESYTLLIWSISVLSLCVLHPKIIIWEPSFLEGNSKIFGLHRLSVHCNHDGIRSKELGT